MKKNTQSINSTRKSMLGQGMTEYIIIVALIAVSAIGVTSMFGQTIRQQVSCAAAQLSGQNCEHDKATKTAKKAVTLADTAANLGNTNVVGHGGI